MNRKVKTALPDTRSVDIEDFYAVEVSARQFNIPHEKLKEAVWQQTRSQLMLSIN